MPDKQLQINDESAWRIVYGGVYYTIEPFFGAPTLGSMALTIKGLWFFHDKGWVRAAASNDVAAGVLRLMLDAKAGWDNERAQLKEQIEQLEMSVNDLEAQLSEGAG